MAITLVVGTNTYVSLAGAETYMEGRYDPTGKWTAATDATKNIILAHATKTIDAQVWRYEKTDDDQTLEFPRNGEESIETPVANATVEQALYLLLSEPDGRATLQAQGVRSFTLGSLSESYATGSASAMCEPARQLMSEYMIMGACIV